jgi:hypothetical protein
MKTTRLPLFRGRQFEPEIIVTCVRWYLRFSLSLRDVKELMAERGLIVKSHDHLALVSAVWTDSLPASEGSGEIQTDDLARRRDVIISPPLHLTRPHREKRRPIQGLNLRFLIDAKLHCMFRRINVQPHDVPTFSISNESGDSLKVSLR